MPDYRELILLAALEASRVHHERRLSEQIRERGGRIGIFEIILGHSIPLLFKSLDTLLGVYLQEPRPGILVTTKRQLSVQRFTAAHEFGHYLFGHQPSLDDESILLRSPYDASLNYKPQEAQADAFAAELLLPKWLLAHHFEKQGWNRIEMRDSSKVYQLSLRVGVSYRATCISLYKNKIIDGFTYNGLVRENVGNIKRRILRGYNPPSMWGDVWFLTKRDEGERIEGGHSDLFIISLTEHSSSGYLWNFDQLFGSGFAVVQDNREGPSKEIIGGEVTRFITLQSSLRHEGKLSMSERRLWESDTAPLSSFGLNYTLLGPEIEGYSHLERRLLLEAA